jgi:small subunit ribosomal protein S20
MAQGTAIKHKKKSKSVLKNIRQTVRTTAVNRANLTRVRSAMKQMRTALGNGDADAAGKLAQDTYSQLDRAVVKGVLKKNTASRYKSRLSLALNSLRAEKKT